MKSKIKFSNIWKHGKSTFIGCLIALFLFVLVWPLKVAPFSDVSPLLMLVVPFLLWGKKPKVLEDE